MSLILNRKLTAEQRIHKATVDIIGREEFVALAGVLMIGTKRVCDSTPTAYTDGRNEVYGRAFVDKLTDAELRFVMLHEVNHKMYRHLTTWKHLWELNKGRANKACDFVINLKIIETDAALKGWIKMPEGGLLDPKYTGMNVPQVYKILKDEDGGGGGSGSNGFDEHGWEEANSLSAEEQKELAKEIDDAVRQGSILASKVGSGGNRLLNELLQTKQDWRELLQDFVKTTCSGKDYSTWKRVNRRYVGMDMLMPGSISEAVGDIVIATDTSGSIGNRELAYFMGEVTGICEQVKPSRVHLIYWDTAVAAHEIYLQEELENLVRSTKPAGGGGTDVECVTAYLREHSIKPECVVVLTDGYLGGDWGTWDVPVLWAINGNKNAVAPIGKTIHID